VVTGSDTTTAGPDLTGCDREPIHIPGSIQPHGFLLVLAEPGYEVVRASENVGALTGRPGFQVPGSRLTDVLGSEVAAALEPTLPHAPADRPPIPLGIVTVNDRRFDAVAHRVADEIVLELEVVPPWDGPTNPYPVLETFTDRAEAAPGVPDLCRVVAEEVRRLTGFDRVLVYRFDEGWNGTVVGEDRNDRFPLLLDHRFPASDIPAQARDLYLRNRLRLIPDAGYRPVPVNPARPPLDLTFSVLRSVSPVHVEYMRNMETTASASISVVVGGRLWGLISCHHRAARAVPYAVRTTCDLLARAFALRLTALELAHASERAIGVRSAYATLLAVMTDRLDYAAGLSAHPDELLAVADARGAAILGPADCVTVGLTPAEAEVRAVADWLFREVRREVYATDSLPRAYPPADPFKDRGCGLLAVSVSQIHPHYVLWFRPELVRDVKWAGNPHKAAETELVAGGRIHPRRSFATWREAVRGTSAPWQPGEVGVAVELRNAIVGVVLRKAEHVAELTAELERSNKELEAFSYSVSHDLRAPLRHVAGYAEILREGTAGKLSPREERCLATIIESSEYAGTLVDKLLAFSRLGRGQLALSRVDTAALVREVVRDLDPVAAGRVVEWRIGPLPDVSADLMMFRLAVRNLLENALKYTRSRERAVVEIGSRDEAGGVVFFVRDNGVGFDPRYADKLFGVFQRLHRMEDYEGTGIGLANVRRIVDRHGGRTWAEGAEGHGATFYFTLPRGAGAAGEPRRDAEADPSG
jgi:light-regulated signal transduction histidine kinase (bacteriophytochrome)